LLYIKKQQQVDIIFIHNILGILVSSFDSDLYIYSKMQLNVWSSQWPRNIYETVLFSVITD